MALLRIRYKKSVIGYNQRQRDTVRSLGLSKLGATVEKEDSPTLRGMLHAVRHLVEFEEVTGETSTGGRA